MNWRGHTDNVVQPWPTQQHGLDFGIKTKQKAFEQVAHACAQHAAVRVITRSTKSGQHMLNGPAEEAILNSRTVTMCTVPSDG